MALAPVSLGVRSNPSRDGQAARLINCYAENADQEGKIQYPIYACDGFSSFATMSGTGAGFGRGMFAFSDSVGYVGTGTRINKVTSTGGVTDLGALNTSGYVYFARNRRAAPQIAVVTSDGLFRLITSDVVSTPSVDSDVGAELFNSVCQIDGYFVFTKSDGEWYISAIDAATIDDLNFETTASNPDGLVRGMVRGRDLVLLGERSTEFWTNTGATDFPFERAGTADFGCYSAPAAVNVFGPTQGGGTLDTIIMPATSSQGSYLGVVILSGYQAEKISPLALDRSILAETTRSSIRGFTYNSRGHTFYTITGSTFSWTYDATTGFWHERKSSGLERWRVVDAMALGSVTVFADYTDAVLYQLSTTITPGSASTLTLRHSDDVGATWTSGRTKSIGTTGGERTRAKFNRLGQSKEDGKLFELVISNAVIENGTGVSMTIRPPLVHSYPTPMRFHRLYVGTVPGVSLTSASKGITGMAVDAEGLTP